MQASKYTILCVDDDRDNLDLLSFVFEHADFKVLACDSLDECLDYAGNEKLDAIILDNRFGNQTSLEVCRQIRALNPDIPIVFYSGEAREIEIRKVMQACADAYLIKPNDFEKLTQTVVELIQEAHPSV
ncbi:MAG TPA: response regulator [Pyrinomonadaceae bacterium]|nr:response regulator [Pyrinomonadaceae bacterium]